jgi:Uncharacterized protein conserved in bacteria (DUF2252)
MLLAGGSNYRYLRLARDTWPTEEHPISFMSDTAFKAVGVGSVETFCAVGLFVSADGDPLFLQKKLENPRSNALVQNSVAIRADESLKVNTSCRHRATFFLVARKTTIRSTLLCP